ncbi:glycosyltransferase family 4 protein [Sphaerisporangium sp. B11E5]|uniref:glycosyltransferase family 4 protein n=1 Tax=Sphaerisporangium sp. B11E5 TaxID=3153563 RepID=UPI00325ED31E
MHTSPAGTVPPMAAGSRPTAGAVPSVSVGTRAEGVVPSVSVGTWAEGVVPSVSVGTRAGGAVPRGVSVLVVGSHPLADDDANLTVARGLAERLGGRYEFVVPRGPSEPARLDLHPVHVHRVRAGGRLDYLMAARRAVDDVTAGTWQVLMSSNPLAAMVIESTRARRARPHIFHIQGEIVRPGPEYGGPAKRLALAAVTRLGVRRASGVRVVSESLRAAVEPRAACPVAVIGSRVDTRLFHPGAGTPGAPQVDAVMVGGLEDVKNHITVVRAWPDVAALVPGARLLIVGEGRRRDRLEAEAAALGVRHLVEFRGRVPHTLVPAVLTSARLLIHPSWSEGQPRAVLEGMACGLPVVCSDIPAHREIVPPRAGRLVPPSDPHGFAETVAKVLGTPDAAAEMGLHGRTLVTRHHDQVKGLDRYADFIRAVAASHRGTHGR